MKADFSALDTPGSYALEIPGLGRSLPFTISLENSLYFARCYATGILNQRCGLQFGTPYSRHGHAACHTAPSQIPTEAPEFSATWEMIAACNADWTGAAPRLVSPETQLYPIVRQGAIDTTGGHHDAGDYSKYTINSAQLIHSLVFAADAFPNAGALDNLGIPESGDGKSDLLQEALHEASYLAKLQDDDGGFFFLVYPKNRKYENDVLPQFGDPQVVWPKNTSATAAAVGALADIASSPRFRTQFPAEAAKFLAQARAGWDFLMRAIDAHGKDGSYQKITHYGDVFGHNDELAWAAAALFAATGDPACHAKLIEWYDPSDPQTIRWSWWSLFEGYGCAARSYAFAARTGKRSAEEMNPTQLAKSEAIIISRGNDLRSWADQSAYGVSFALATKRSNSAGWFFPVERAFDIVAAEQILPNPANLATVLSNLNFKFGANPLNLTYVTGCGLRNQQEIVSQFAQNDDRRLPPSGIPVGAIQSGFTWSTRYQSELSTMNVPSDAATTSRYPFYDRWADTFNVSTESVIAQQGKGLATVASIAASRPTAVAQPWSPATTSRPIIQFSGFTDGFATVGQPFTASLSCPDGTDLSNAVILWETSENQPVSSGNLVSFTPTRIARQWLEVEALTADGKRLCARAEFGVKAALPEAPATVDDTTIALYSFDSGWTDDSPNGFHLTPHGAPTIEAISSGWAANAATNQSVRFRGNDDGLTVTIPDRFISPLATPTPLALEFRICPLRFTNYGKSNRPLACLSQGWAYRFGANQNMWANPLRPDISADNVALLTAASWDEFIVPATWNHIRIARDAAGQYQLTINGSLVATGSKSTDFGGSGDWTLDLGHFDGYLDDLRLTGLPNHGSPDAGDDSGTTGGSGSTGGTGSTGGSGSTGGTETPPPTTLVSPFSRPLVSDAQTTALYHLDGDLTDSSSNRLNLNYIGEPVFVATTNAKGAPNGYAIRFRKFGDALKVTVPDSLISPGSTATALTLETWILPRAYKAWGNDQAGILSLYQNWDSTLGVVQDKWLTPAQPAIRSGSAIISTQAEWSSFVQPGVWQHLQIVRTSDGQTTIRINGKTIKTSPSPNAWSRTNDWSFTIGNIDADLDEIRISRTAQPPLNIDELEPDAATLALYHFNGDATDSGPNSLHLNAVGSPTYDSSAAATAWMQNPSGSAVRFETIDNFLTIPIPNTLISPGIDTTPLTIEARILPYAWKAYGRGGYSILRLYQHWDSNLGLFQDKWVLPEAPQLMVSTKPVLTSLQLNDLLKKNEWNHLKICRTARRTTVVTINGVAFPEVLTPTHDGRTNDWSLVIGNFQGLVDEVRISRDER